MNEKGTREGEFDAVKSAAHFAALNVSFMHKIIWHCS